MKCPCKVFRMWTRKGGKVTEDRPLWPQDFPVGSDIEKGEFRQAIWFPCPHNQILDQSLTHSVRTSQGHCSLVCRYFGLKV